MPTVNRLLTNICSRDLEASKAFYTKLFDFEAAYDSDWFVNLISKEHQLELGIISAESEIVPPQVQAEPQGFYLTLVVENADAIFDLAKAEKLDILSEPEDTFYGQRRLLLRDPDGTVVDVSSPIPDFEFPAE